MIKKDVEKIIKQEIDKVDEKDLEITKAELEKWLCEESEKRGLFEMAEGVCNEDGVPWCDLEFSEEIKKLIEKKKK